MQKQLLLETNQYPSLRPSEIESIVQSASGTETISVKVTDAAGKVVIEKELLVKEYFSKLDLNLLNGVYFVEITNKEKKREYKKLVISK